MKKNTLPNLFEIGRAASVSISSRANLSADQKETQEELRTGMHEAYQSSIGGVIFPWYSEVGREQRAMTANDAAAGGFTIGTELADLGAGLRSNLALEKLGARVFGGLKSAVRIGLPNTLIAADWKSETADAPDGSFTFMMRDLKPHRLTAYLDVTWQLLVQGIAIEQYLRSELMVALATEIQRVAINGTGGDNQPLGIINTPGIGEVVGGDDGAAPTYENITDLEYLVSQGNDREHTGWLVSPAIRRKLRRTAMFADGSIPIWSNEESRVLLGHPAAVTTSIPDDLIKGASGPACSSIIHAEFTELFLGLWGSGIIVEAVPFGGHSSGKTRFLATAFADSVVRAPEAFSAQKDALCAV